MRYPVAGPAGGGLIRQVISFLRRAGTPLPLTSDILIAISGGPDSTALAHLFCKYGRRITAPSRVHLVHVQHGWAKPAAAKRTVRRLERLAVLWGADLTVRRARTPGAYGPGSSWEAEASADRRTILLEEAGRWGAGCRVVTAHTQEDLAETVLWRLLTGVQAHGGIWANQGPWLRPMLTVNKRTLLAFLKEEGVAFTRDPSNRDPRFLRARMRTRLFPELEKIFPKGVAQLAKQGLDAQLSKTEMGK